MKTIIRTLLLTGIVASQAATASTFSYDFNNLSAGALVGQDGWQNMGATASIQLGTGSHDGSLYANSGDGWAAHQRSASFALPDYANASSGVFGADMWSQDWGSYMGLSTGSDFSAGTLYLNFDDQRNEFRLRGTSFTDITISNFSSIVDTTWIRARVLIDFTANNGAGSASVFVQDLLDSNASMIAVTGMQNVNIGLTPGTGDNSDPASWEYAFIGELAGLNGVDNLYFEATITPTPGSMALAMFGLIGLAGFRRLKSRHPARCC